MSMDAKKRELLEALLRQRGVDPASLPIPPRSGDPGAAPLSFAQERLWVLERLEPGRPTYNEAYSVRFTGPLSPAALAAALGEIARRHAVLRTHFEVRDGRPLQVIAPEAALPLPCADLAALPAERRGAEAERQELAAAETPFDLARGPLARALLLRLGVDEHRLVLTLHHILCDATSIEILVDELVTLHAAAARGAASPLPEPALQYADFAAWQRERQAATLERQLAEWRERLAGAPTLLELPADRPRSDAPRGRGATLSVPLPAPLSRAVKALAQAEGATLFMTLLAAFETLVALSTGRRDFLLGTPIAGRTRPEVQRMPGFFVNTLALRAGLDGDPTFREVLARARRTVSAAFDRQEVPFSRLVEELRPERSPGRSPLVQVLFLLQKPGARIDPGEGLDFALRRIETGTAKFELTFLTRDAGEEIVCGVEHDADLFLPATMARLLDRYRALLEAVAADPEIRLADLDLMTPAERQQALVEWNDAARDRPWGTCVHELIAAQAARAPEAPAVISDEGTLTYGELVAGARRLARRLRTLGVGTDELVGLCLQPSPDLMVAVLGILEAGGAYVPLDPGQPAERLAWMLADTGLRVVVTESALADRLPAAGPAVVRIDAERAALAALPATPLERWATPESLAYQIYTSGSTGRPKGVMVPHRGLTSLVLSFAESFRLGPGERMLLFLSLSFDAAVGDLFPPLVSGAALVVHRQQQSLLGRSFDGFLERQRVTCIELATAFWQQWVEDLAARGQAPPSALRTVVVGGESVAADKVRTWFRLLAGRPFRLRNHYGPTEATVCASAQEIADAADLAQLRVPIGRPLPNVRLHLLGPDLRPVPAGTAGEIAIGGSGVTRGYLGRPDVTAERFIPDPFGPPGARLYRTGDLARHLPDGNVDFLGRVDHQVKIRGYRIEPGEIEAALADHPGVREAVVLARSVRSDGSDRSLVAYLVGEDLDAAGLRAFLKGRLPAYMMPDRFVFLDRLPLNTSGKVDRRALPAPPVESSGEAAAAPASELERRIAAIWRAALRTERVGVDDNFFDLGGHSLLLIEIEGRLRDELGREVAVVDLFRHPTVASLAAFLGGEEERRPALAAPARETSGRQIAIVGMAGRFPGARDPEQLWRNLCAGVESITFFSADGPADPAFVPAKGVLDEVARFDAELFGVSPREAELLDPQHRQFLECAWEALESAGRDSARHPGAIGVFAGVGRNSYLINNLLGSPERLRAAGLAPALLGNDKDFVPTRVSYKLGLRGPSVAVQTACSTSLVAVHLACRSLLDGECDVALAGGASVPLPQAGGYAYEEGGIFSPDGHCRAFDADARGTVPGSGVGIVVLRRLADALADGDFIHAVIRGSAINNDGSLKAGYTAPSPEGQARVLREALGRAGVDAASVSYVETHGTGTQLGDAIEVAALKEVYGTPDREPGACALGALKTNVGHMDTAAGVGGLIKAALALRHRRIPPTLHFRRPGPQLGLDGGPFRVPTAAWEWESPEGPRRAGVSSFGIGGTNAHVVLEEAPVVSPVTPQVGAAWQLIPLSARTPTALEAAAGRLADRLDADPGLSLADVAWTLQTGRRSLPHARFAVCQGPADAAAALRSPDRTATAARPARPRPVAFLLPGQGAQAAGMGGELYREQPVFAAAVDRCAEVLLPLLGRDLRDLLVADPEPGGDERLAQTSLAQPAIFTVSWALAELWRSWGVEPAALIGHSLGEYVAACLAGVMTLEEALELVALRGRLMQALPPGGMLSMLLPEAETRERLTGGLALAAVNAPDSCAVSGPLEEIEELARRLAEQGIEHRRLRVSHAFHSAMMDPILEEFGRAAERVRWKAPRIPYLSNLTGEWITAEEAARPDLWVRHLRETVRFSAGLETLLATPDWVLLEVGPGRTLSALARRHPAREAGQTVLASLPLSGGGSRLAAALTALGRLWLAGIEPRWEALHPRRPRRVPLPTYPFEGKDHWVASREERAERPLAPAWRPAPPPPDVPEDGAWVVLGSEEEPGRSLVRCLVAQGRRVVEAGPASHVVSLLGLCSTDGTAVRAALALSSRLNGDGNPPPRLVLFGTGMQEVGEGDLLLPEGAALAGVAAALRRSGHPCWTIDLESWEGMDPAGWIADCAGPDPEVAYRAGRRWVRSPEPRTGGQPAEEKAPAAVQRPAGGIAGRLAEIWGEVLGIAAVDAGDDYFELGGDSLLAIRLLARVREELGVDLGMEALLREPTLAGLARRVDAARLAAPAEAPIAPAPRDRPLPLSFIQEEVWRNLTRPHGVPQHNAAVAYRGTGDLDITALSRALGEILRRHEVLRTTFPVVDGSPIQLVAPPSETRVPVVDLRALPERARTAETERLAVEAYRERFDFARGPFLRLVALRLGEREHALLRTVGRMVTDGASLALFLDELMELYDAFTTGREPRLTPLPLQYGDFAAWQRQRYEALGADADLAYWLEQLRGVPARLRLRTDLPPPAVQSFRGSRQGVPVPPALYAALRALGRGEGATPFMVLLTLWEALLHRWSGAEDIVLATPITHRRPETEAIMGRFLNTLALRVDLSGDPTFRELLRRVREVALGAYLHQDLPFERLLQELAPVPSPAHRPLVQVSFVLQEHALPRLRLGNLELTPFWVDRGGSDFELTLGFSQQADGGLDGFLEYQTSLFRAESAAEMARHFRALAEAVASDPDRRLSALMRGLEEEPGDALAEPVGALAGGLQA